LYAGTTILLHGCWSPSYLLELKWWGRSGSFFPEVTDTAVETPEKRSEF
jgi:hypothetical protein